MSAPVIWDDGVLRPLSEVRISPLDRGFTLGDGVFETIAVRDGRPLRLAAHLARLHAAASGIALRPPSALDADLGAAIAALAEANGLSEALAALRLSVSRGEGARGLAPPDDGRSRAFMAMSSAAPGRDAADVVILRDRLRQPGFAAEHKTLSYADNVEALLAARRYAPNADEAVRLTGPAGDVVSGGCMSNIFWLKDGVVFTPDESCAIRAGVMREAVLAAARSSGLSVKEGRFGLNALSTAEAAFLTNALQGVRAVSALRIEAEAPVSLNLGDRNVALLRDAVAP